MKLGALLLSLQRDYKRILEHLCNKLANPGEMYNCLEPCNLPRLNHKEIAGLHRDWMHTPKPPDKEKPWTLDQMDPSGIF